MLSGFSAIAQPDNDACADATELCPNTSYSGTTIGATATSCSDCEDDLAFCFIGTNSVWYTFTTNASGGNVTVDISNLVFSPGATLGTQLQAAMFQATTPCDASTFTLVSNCVSSATTNFQLNATGLLPNTDYVFVITGAINGTATQPARASFEVEVSGPGADRLPVTIGVGQPAGELCPQTQAGFALYVGNCTDTTNITWSVNGELTAITESNLWWTSDLQDGDVVSVTCTCFDVCPVTVNYTCNPVVVNDLTVDAGLDQTVTSGTTVTLSGTTNGTDYQWTPALQVISPTSLTTLTEPSVTTTYFLTASNDLCSLSDDVTVFISDNMTVPGSFSPNGDGVNDVWYIPGIENYPNAQMTIYSRWGQIVAQVTGYSYARSWDGTHNGKPVPDGVYFYELDLHDGETADKIKGNISVIR